MAIGEIQIRQQAGRDQNRHVFTGIGDSLPASSEDIQDKVQMIQGVLCLLQTVPVYYPYATSDKSILWEYGTKVLKFPQKSEGLLIK